ncbi:MAG: DUF4390 domain-containing protein [Acidobacteriota bacterium]
MRLFGKFIQVVTLSACFAPWVLTPAVASSEDVSVAGLRVDTTSHDIYVSFEVKGAFTEEIRERIDSGLPVTFQYDMEVSRRRAFWFDKTLVRKKITTTVSYDTLTRQYSLSKKMNGEVAETSVAVNDPDMMRWMTHLDRIRLGDPTALGAIGKDSLYVRVKSRLQRKFLFFFIPSSLETGWEKIGLSLPVEGMGRAR